MTSDRDVTTEVVKDAVTFPRTRLGEPRTIKPEDFDSWLDRVKREAAAEALEAAARNQLPHPPFTRPEIWSWLHNRADEIREGN